MNIYVGNLSWSMTDEDLSTLFSEYGTVTSAKILKDKMNGRSKGFGFVEMSSDDEGKDAMLGLNNKEVEGRAMSVSVAKEREERSSNGGGGSRGGYGNNRNSGGGGGRW